MFTLAQPACYSSYNPYEELLLQQELQRRRQVEAYLRRQREAEELERRRQFEYAIRQAEVERRRQAEYERRRAEVARRSQEAELQRRCDAERRRHSMFNTGVQDLFDMIYGGGTRLRARSMSPRASPAREQSESSQRNTVSSDERSVPAQTPSFPTPSPAPKPSPSAAVVIQETDDESPRTDTAPSLAAVQSILASFAALQSEFTFPSQLDFLPSSSASAHKLAYTSNNAPIHGYEHALTSLLTQLDAVESFGDDEVRRARKEAVKAIERELEELDSRKAVGWRQRSDPEVLAAQDAESSGTQPAATVDPLAIPLPDDSGAENQDEEMGEAASEVLPNSDHSGVPASNVSTESPLVTPETFSTLVQSLVVEDLSPIPDSPMTIASPIAPELPGLTPLAIPSDTSPEPLSQSLGSPSSEASDAESDMELKDYVDVDHVLASEDEMEQEDAELEEAEKDGDLELIRDWDLNF